MFWSFFFWFWFLGSKWIRKNVAKGSTASFFLSPLVSDQPRSSLRCRGPAKLVCPIHQIRDLAVRNRYIWAMQGRSKTRAVRLVPYLAVWTIPLLITWTIKLTPLVCWTQPDICSGCSWHWTFLLIARNLGPSFIRCSIPYDFPQTTNLYSVARSGAMMEELCWAIPEGLSKRHKWIGIECMYNTVWLFRMSMIGNNVPRRNGISGSPIESHTGVINHG